jgi:hypothetical protein
MRESKEMAGKIAATLIGVNTGKAFIIRRGLKV